MKLLEHTEEELTVYQAFVNTRNFYFHVFDGDGDNNKLELVTNVLEHFISSLQNAVFDNYKKIFYSEIENKYKDEIKSLKEQIAGIEGKLDENFQCGYRTAVYDLKEKIFGDLREFVDLEDE